MNKLISIRFAVNYNVCNYKCPYCVAQKNKSTQKPWDKENYLKIMSNMLKLPFSINLRIGVAGEIFLSDTLIDSTKKLSHHEKIHALNLITNLSFPAEKYDSILKDFNKKKLGIVASYHPTEIKDIGIWTDAALYMNEHVDFIVCMVAHPENLEQLIEKKIQLNKIGIDIFLQSFRGMYKNKKYPENYSEKELSIIREHCYSDYDYQYGFLLKKPEQCYAGHSHFLVEIDGSVHRCGYYKSLNKPLGDLLNSSEITIDDGPKECMFPKCLCDTDNINTVFFKEHYVHTGKNQHKYTLKSDIT